MLERQVLVDGLDHQVTAGQVGHRAGRGDPGEHLVPARLGQPAALDRLVEQPAGVVLALLGGCRRDVAEHHLEAVAGRHVGDPGAHHAGAEHRDPAGGARRLTGRPAAACVDGVQVEPECRDHVLGDLATDQVGQVAGLDPQRGVQVHLAALDRRRQDVVRGRHRRALELLAQGGGEGGQHRRERRAGRGAAGDLVTLAVPGLGRLRVGRDPAPGRGQQLVGVVGELVHDAGLDRLRRAQPLPLSSSLVRASAMPSSRTVRVTPPPPGSRPRVTSGRPNSAFGRSSAIRWWQASAISSPPPSAVPFSSRHHRTGVGLQPAQLGLEPLGGGEELRRGLVGDRAEQPQVAAGEEGVLGRGEDHPGDAVLLVVEPVDHRPERVLEGGVHDVGPLGRVVHGQRDDAVGVPAPADHADLVGGLGGGRHQIRSTIVATPMPPPTHSVASP